MDAVHPSHERNGLFATLTALTLLVTGALVAWRGDLLVPAWQLAALALPSLAFAIFLRVRRDTAGREGRVLDLWSIPHVAGGMLLGLVDIPLVHVALLVTWWELVEVISRQFEHVSNRIADIVLALAGWLAAQLVVAGALPLW